MKVKCEKCDREFSTFEGLSSHERDKHAVVRKEIDGKKINSKYIFIGIGIVILILVIFSTPIVDIGPGKYDEFATCLTESGARMYGAYWCSHCQDQKKEFGSSWEFVEYIECSLPNNGGQTQACITAEIESYPTWEFEDDSRKQGLVSLEDLSEKSGCELPE
jgi:thiol-disulfide isomerase/thioredoxin